MRHFKVLLFLSVSCIIIAAIQSESQQDIFSRLWGYSGEKWEQNGILQDFSRAGYNQANTSIPNWKEIANIENFGANGKDSIDDTKSIQVAIQKCPFNGVVYIPEGYYIITDTILIKKSNVVIRGAGIERTKLYFPKGLNSIYPKRIKASNPKSRIAIQKANTTESSIDKEYSQNGYTTAWSWSGGFIWFQNCTNVGIENLTLAFRDTPYLGHFKELGSNGVNFKLVKNGWASNLAFYNCDSGIFADSCQFLTFKDFEFNQYAGRGKIGGHHGIDFSKSSYCLMEGAIFNNRMIHELGVEHRSHHNVYASCKGINLHLDHHQIDVHDNLWTNIDLGEGTAVWQTNAKALQRTKSGSTKNEVYWNIKSKRNFILPDPQLNNVVVGVLGTVPQETQGSWYEIIDPLKLRPVNIYAAQLAYRQKLKHRN